MQLHDSYLSKGPYNGDLFHTLLPAIETTDVIGNTENKQVKRNMK